MDVIIYRSRVVSEGRTRSLGGLTPSRSPEFAIHQRESAFISGAALRLIDVR
jgi:hypothetical protein